MPLEYKGYTAAIDIDPEDGTFSGTVQGLRDVIHFEGTDGPSLLQAFRDSIDDYLTLCAERGEQPDKPWRPQSSMHPGELLREDVLPALGRPATEIAGLLKIPLQNLQAILREEASVTPAMALRLGKLCGNGPDLWLNLQVRHDLDRLSREIGDELARIPTLTPA